MLFRASYSKSRKLCFDLLGGVATAYVFGNLISGEFKYDQVEFRDGPKSRMLEAFVNLPDDPTDMLNFTRKYGPPLAIPVVPGGPFSFTLDDFRSSQAYFRGIWMKPRKLDDWEENDGRLRFEGDTLTYTSTSLFTYFRCVFAINDPERMMVCKRDGCLHPYFIAAHLKKQYCSIQCAGEAQKRAKRDWWQRSGQEQRNERLAKSSKSISAKRAKV
jgi:hypothetical protein